MGFNIATFTNFEFVKSLGLQFSLPFPCFKKVEPWSLELLRGTSFQVMGRFTEATQLIRFERTKHHWRRIAVVGSGGKITQGSMPRVKWVCYGGCRPQRGTPEWSWKIPDSSHWYRLGNLSLIQRYGWLLIFSTCLSDIWLSPYGLNFAWAFFFHRNYLLLYKKVRCSAFW